MLATHFEDFLATDDSLSCRDRTQQRVEQRCFSRLRAARDDDVASADNRGFQEGAACSVNVPPASEIVDAARANHETSDVHRPVLTSDIRNDHVKSAAIGQRRIDERLGEI